MVTKRRAKKCVTHHCCDCKAYEIEQLRQALRIIATWAACDASDPRPRSEAMYHIQELAKQTLQRLDNLGVDMHAPEG